MVRTRVVRVALEEVVTSTVSAPCHVCGLERPRWSSGSST